MMTATPAARRVFVIRSSDEIRLPLLESERKF
jgi:hypothetical protein